MIVFYSKPWTVELHLELERRWSASGWADSFEHLTQHLEVAERLERDGRTVRFLTSETERVDLADPRASVADIERRYRPGIRPLNRYRLAERYFQEREPDWQLDQVARYAAWFDDYFSTRSVSAIIGNAPDEMAIWLAFDIARCNGAEVVAMLPSVVPPDRTCLLDDYAEIRVARHRFEELRSGGLTDEDRDRAKRAQAAVPKGSNLSYLFTRTAKDRLRRILNGTFAREQLAHTRVQSRERKAGNWYLQPTTAQWMSARLAAKVRARVADRRYLTAAKPTGPYLFFPLHFQPEASTLIAGSYFTNQIEVVKNLARSVPIDWEVVVKEHFWMRGQRGLEAYRELQRIANVRMVSFDVPTYQLIEDAEVISTVTGTSGLEAALWGKPVVSFGEAPWDYGPTVRRVEALRDLPETIAEAWSQARPADDDDVLAYAASWDEALPSGKYYEDPVNGWNDQANIALIAVAIESKIGAGAPLAPAG